MRHHGMSRFGSSRREDSLGKALTHLTGECIDNLFDCNSDQFTSVVNQPSTSGLDYLVGLATNFLNACCPPSDVIISYGGGDGGNP